MDHAAVHDAVAAVRARVIAAGGEGVTLVAVTKGFGPDAVRAVLAAGCSDIGESYAQETVAKLSALGDEVAPVVHFVGRLQTNKVRLLVPFVHVWDSVDRVSVVDELCRRAPGARVLVQVNITSEASKAGVTPDALPQLLERARVSGIEVEGLMAIGPTHGSAESARPGFRLLRRLVDEHGLRECSMGMSHDLDVAVEEGSTQVRIGSAIFGPRPQQERQVG